MIKLSMVIIFVIPIVIYTPIMYLIAIIMKMLKFNKLADKLIFSSASFFSGLLFKLLHSEVKVINEKKIPASKNICIISNHQSMFDIPVTLAFSPINTGFIAKKSLGKIPILNLWMKGLYCLLIDRKNIRNARKTINLGIEQIKRGFPLVIFPEGTRSRNNTVAKFRKGSLKLAIKSNCIIIPQTIKNSYKLYEEKNRFNSANVDLIYHDPIYTSELTKDEIKELPDKLHEIICAGLK